MTFTSVMKDSNLSNAVKSHPRYHLRVTAIIAVAIGIFLNILAISIARQRVLSGIAFLPLCISMVYNLIDLNSKSLFKRYLGLGFLFVFDTLGFLSFLGLLIANGIIATPRGSYRYNYSCHRSSIEYKSDHITRDTFLLAYASAPWLLCCSIHGFIVLRDVLRILITNIARPVCTNCRHDMREGSTGPINETRYSQIAGDYNPEDVERNAVPKDNIEPSPMRESSESTDETSRLFTPSRH